MGTFRVCRGMTWTAIKSRACAQIAANNGFSMRPRLTGGICELSLPFHLQVRHTGIQTAAMDVFRPDAGGGIFHHACRVIAAEPPLRFVAVASTLTKRTAIAEI